MSLRSRAIGHTALATDMERRLFLAALLALAALPLRAADAPGDLLQFMDGSALHGVLHSIDPQKGVRWQQPDAKQLIEFTPLNLHQVKLAHARPALTNPPPTCRFRFGADDEVYGSLVALDAESVTLETWFAGRLTAPRRTLRSVTFLNSGQSTLYEGPTSIEGWKVGPAPDVWKYQDGGFTASGFGFLGRDVKLGPMSRLEFDLAWSGQLNLIVSVYSDNIDRFDWISSAYQFNIGAGYVNLMRGQGQAGMAYLGQAQIPAMMQKNKVRLGFLVNKEQASLALLADGVVVQTWRDAAGFAGKGTGLLFYSQRQGPTLRVSDIKITAWDGKPDEPVASTNLVTEAVVKLANGDSFTGTVNAVRDGKVSVSSAAAKLDIPLARVTQILLPDPTGEKFTRKPGELHAQLFGGERVTLAVQKWDRLQVAGHSPHFGALTLKPQWVKLIQFHAGPAKSASETGFNDAEPFIPLE